MLSSISPHFDIALPLQCSGKVRLFLQMTSLLKLIRTYTFFKNITEFAESLGIPYAVYRIVLLITGTCIYIHLFSCIITLGRAYLDGYLMDLEDISKEKESSRDYGYISGIYLSTILTATAGYGEKTPETMEATIFVIVAWILGKIARVILLVRLMQVVKAMLSSNHQYVGMVRQLSEYMKYKGLPEYMQRRLLTYYEFRFQKSYFKENEILSTISGHLRQEIVMHSSRRLVESVSFFKNIPLNLLGRIVSCLHSEIFLANDVIVKSNITGNSMYFIASGTVAVYTSSGREICHLEDGAHFGEIALVMKDQLRVAVVVAVEICELYRLDRKEFIRAIYPYPDLLDKIQRIASDRMEKTALLDEHDRRELATKHVYY